MYIFEHLCKNIIQWAPVSRMCIWSDGGRHFRSNQSIATLGCRAIEYLCRHSENRRELPEVSICYGVASHFKNACDGAQANLKTILDSIAQESTISTIPQMVEKSRELYDEFAAVKKPKRMPAFWHDFSDHSETEQFEEGFMLQFASASYKELISHCHCYVFRLNDKRRRAVPLYKNPAGVLTGLDFKSAMLRDGARVPADRVTLPRVVELTRDLPDEEVVDAKVREALAEEFRSAFGEEGSGCVSMLSKEVLGWACSYRVRSPELQSFEDWRKRWSKARARFGDIPLLAPRIRPTVSEALTQQQSWRDRRKVPKAS